MSSEWEKVVEEIEEKLLTLSAPDLNDICAALSLAEDKNEKDSPRMLRRCILQYLEGEDITSREDEGMSVLLELNDKIDEVKQKNIESNESFPQQVVQERHLVDENVIDGSNLDEQRESVPVLNATKASPVATHSASLVPPAVPKRLENSWTNWRTKSKR